MKKKRELSFLAVVVLTFIVNVSYAQILGWNFSSPDTKGNEEAVSAKFKDPNLKSSELTRGEALLNTNTYNRSFISKLSLVGTSDNTKEKAFSKGAYYQFKLQPNKGYTVSLSALNAKLRPGAGGPYYYRWTYSLDGKKFKELGEKDNSISFNYGKPEGLIQPMINLSDVSDLQKVDDKKGVVFRLYIWGGTNPETATFSIGRSEVGDAKTPALSLEGEVKSGK